MYGVPESNAEEATAAKTEDSESIVKIIEATKINASPVYHNRLGKQSTGKTRPIVVGFADNTQVIPIISASKSFKDTIYAKVFINKDLTEAERHKEFELRVERRTKNEELQRLDPNSPFIYCIRRNTVVRLKKHA